MISTDDLRFLVVDFEFTAYADTFGRPKGFFPEIIEVGAVELLPPGFADGRTYESFVRPRFFPKLSEFCRTLTIIEQADVDGGIDIREMIGHVSRLYEPGKTLFTAWGDSDYSVLDQQCRKYGLENPFAREQYLDLALAYRDFKRHRFLSPLAVVLGELGIDQTGYAHTAQADALNTAEVLRHMLAEGWAPQNQF